MIDIKEIRIGNALINTKDDTDCMVSSIDKITGKILSHNGNILYGYPKEYYSRIPISEDILLALGFSREIYENSKKGFYMYLPNGFRIDINKYSNTLGRDYGIHIDNLCCDSVLRGDIQYLHQLQNYIYDATGEELDLKELFK